MHRWAKWECSVAVPGPWPTPSTPPAKPSTSRESCHISSITTKTLVRLFKHPPSIPKHLTEWSEYLHKEERGKREKNNTYLNEKSSDPRKKKERRKKLLQLKLPSSSPKHEQCDIIKWYFFSRVCCRVGKRENAFFPRASQYLFSV